MKLELDQSDFWNKVAKKNVFHHEIDWKIFENLCPSKNIKILDYGCGYGRLCNVLSLHGFQNVIGVDNSNKMIERAKNDFPNLSFKVNSLDNLPFDDDSLDVVLLFTVLTCIPFDTDQDKLLNEIHRVLKKDGILYISDLFLNEDQRNIDRYKKYLNKYGTYGIFELEEEAVLRHHSKPRIKEISAKFHRTFFKEYDVITMNGNKANAFQLFLKK